MNTTLNSAHYVKLKVFSTACFLLFALGVADSNAEDHAGRQCPSSLAARENFINDSWKFILGDPSGASAPDYSDDGWRTVDLPHDWSIEGRPDADNPSGNDGGYYPTGIGWYRKTFYLPEKETTAVTTLYFEGVYMGATVFVNGREVGTRPYGYSSFYYDVTPYLQKGKNTIAVRVDNSRQKNCRWYTGSGIYRNVKLIRTPRLHFEPWGLGVSTTDVDGKTMVGVDVAVRNDNDHAVTFTLRCAVKDRDVEVAVKEVRITLDAAETRVIKRQIPLTEPKLWTVDAPNTYRLECQIRQDDGQAGDIMAETFGVRTITYSPEKGLMLNGRPIDLNGGCVHHDNGCLGAASYRDAEWRKVRLMKEAGFNAVRTSHNVPSESFLDACDSLGLLVIDEAFDGWREAKTTYDYSTLFDAWWTKDVEAMVMRDRNHPSIFCWSIGNEIMERKKHEAVLTAYALAGHVRRLDPTRPVTSALASWDADWEIYDPLAAAHDIVGYNYMMHKGPSDHERVPSRVMMQTESYPNDAFVNWSRVNDYPYIIGDFVWTAIDYLGESGIGRFYYEGESEGEHYERNQYPWHGAYCGDVDLTGWRKPISHYREILYNDNLTLYMGVREPNGYYGDVRLTKWSVWPTWESWNWPGHEGKDVEVEVYSRYPSVRLYLNGKLIGEKPTTRAEEYKAVFTLPYSPGTLRAVGIDGGQEREAKVIETAGKPARIRLTADREDIPADGQSLAYVTVEITDKRGRVVPTADNMLEFEVEGDGVLLATCSADLKDGEAYVLPRRKAWKGRALAVIKSGRHPGKLRLTVKGKGLAKESVELGME